MRKVNDATSGARSSCLKIIKDECSNPPIFRLERGFGKFQLLKIENILRPHEDFERVRIPERE